MKILTHEHRKRAIAAIQEMEIKRIQNTYNVPVYAVISENWEETKQLMQESEDWIENIQKLVKLKKHGYNSLEDDNGAIYYFYDYSMLRGFAANEIFFYHPQKEELVTLTQLEQEHQEETGEHILTIQNYLNETPPNTNPKYDDVEEEEHEELEGEIEIDESQD